MSLRLEVHGASRAFGGVYAVRGVDLAVAPGETHGIIGPNGAGKSTLFHLIGGHLTADEGRVLLDGRRIDRLAPHRRAALGIATVFQGARIFRGLTVLENAMVGTYPDTRVGFAAAALRLPGHRRAERAARERAAAAVEQVGLTPWADRPAESLPLGRQRTLQVARALCARPRLLLLDEPASGLRAAERARLAELFTGLAADGMTTLLIEHDVAFVSRLCDRITVLDLGETIAEGTPDEVRADPRVVDAYLGGEAVA